MDPEKKSLNFIFPTKYVIPKSLKFSHWPSKMESWMFNPASIQPRQIHPTAPDPTNDAYPPRHITHKMGAVSEIAAAAATTKSLGPKKNGVE